MNSPSLRYLLLKLYFPAAFLIAIILLILDATTPPVVAQVRTVTVTVFVTVTQQVYITWERTVMVTVVTGIPTTFTSVITSVVTSAVTSILTQTSVVSSLVTHTVSVQAPIRIGPLSLDLADADGLRFLGFTGGVALTGALVGAAGVYLTKRHQPAPPEPERPLLSDGPAPVHETTTGADWDLREYGEGDSHYGPISEEGKHTRKEKRQPD